MIPLLGVYTTILTTKNKAMDDLVRIFSDTELTVTHLKNLLADSGIESMVKNDFESGVSAGFVAGTTSTVDLYVLEKDLELARPVVEQLKKELKK